MFLGVVLGLAFMFSCMFFLNIYLFIWNLQDLITVIFIFFEIWRLFLLLNTKLDFIRCKISRPIYTKRDISYIIVSVLAYFEFYLNKNLVRPAYRLSSGKTARWLN